MVFDWTEIWIAFIGTDYLTVQYDFLEREGKQYLFPLLAELFLLC